jgi:uncharacterized membrane protein YcfT
MLRLDILLLQYVDIYRMFVLRTMNMDHNMIIDSVPHVCSTGLVFLCRRTWMYMYTLHSDDVILDIILHAPRSDAVADLHWGVERWNFSTQIMQLSCFSLFSRQE